MTTVPAGRYPIKPTQRDLADLKEAILGAAPETLDTLQELAAALGDDPAYFTTIANQVSELNTDVTDVVSALGIAENDSDVGTFTSPTLPDGTTLRDVLEAFASAYDTTKSNLEGSDTALSNRLDTLETDPVTQTYVDGINTALDGRLDTLEADPTTQTLLDAEQTARENADSALSGRLDTLEADPTTQTLLDAEATTRGDADTALSGRLDVLEADPTTQTAVDAKLNTANPAATGDLTVDTNAKLEFDSNLTKLHNDLRGTRIDIGNNITLYPAAAGGRVEVEGEFYLRPSDLTDAADDTAAAAAGIIVGQVYRNGSQLMVRVS
jgi:hypothetical protein